ncbi:hypothetical protein H6G17_31845 [Chroococcidiopsis sp. FACHB-1243]|uniref:hypothetical protein n=1 Tax=Chroococcidiopsis sp. [FACHB-1243] TaxID=2692781 RepID=UPI0017852299|nr:hypothetical protein [Chroococcidiopsis sp. [FACHB-1243]]MBD2309994.1 hypothetical protein [Chroococcidiopsis sp. [FACHB-1243]]
MEEVAKVAGIISSAKRIANKSVLPRKSLVGFLHPRQSLAMLAIEREGRGIWKAATLQDSNRCSRQRQEKG